MVKCDAVDGKPCKCELTKPCIIYLVESIVSNTVKLVLGVISEKERDELQTLTRIPNAKRYIELYLEELDKNREMVADNILKDM